MGEDLDSLSYSLSLLEYAVDPETAVTIKKYRQAIGAVGNSISTPFLINSKVQDVLQVSEAITILANIYIKANPERAAKQFGKALSGLGKIISYLPPPASWYGALLAGSENFFYNNMQNIVPHLKPNFKRVIDQHLQAGDDIMGLND